jgi:hypothetical protein
MLYGHFYSIKVILFIILKLNFLSPYFPQWLCHFMFQPAMDESCDFLRYLPILTLVFVCVCVHLRLVIVCEVVFHCALT